jgi:hypothetical protein
MAMTGPEPGECLLEVHVRGLLHLRVERVPRWLLSWTVAAISAAGGSLLAVHR